MDRPDTSSPRTVRSRRKTLTDEEKGVRFTVYMPPEYYEMLETYRVKTGANSTAEAIRNLIVSESKKPITASEDVVEKEIAFRIVGEIRKLMQEGKQIFAENPEKPHERQRLLIP